MMQVSTTTENLQPKKVYLITKEEERKKVKTVTKHHYNVLLYFLICVDRNKVWKHPNEEYYSTKNHGTFSLTHIILEVHDIG